MNINEKILVVSGLMTWLIVFVVDVVLPMDYTAVKTSLYILFIISFLISTVNELGCTKTPKIYWPLWIQLVCALAIYMLNPGNITPILLVIWISLLPECMSPKRWFKIWVGLNIIILIYNLIDGITTTSMITHLVFMGLQLFAASSSQARINARHAQEELEQKHLELVTTQSLLSEQSEARARLSIARDLHDSIGHKLTVLSLNLEHAIHSEPGANKPFFKDLKRSVNQTLSELRDIVREVRSTKGGSLHDVLINISKAMPSDVNLSFPDPFEVDTISLRDQLAFCIQEAISNALRHGNATDINIQLISSQPLSIRIDDNGISLNQWREGSGLLGMKERLQPYQGEVTLQPRSETTGMSLNISIPDNLASTTDSMVVSPND